MPSDTEDQKMANMSLEEQVGLFISPELPVTMGGHDRRISDGRTFTPDSRFEFHVMRSPIMIRAP